MAKEFITGIWLAKFDNEAQLEGYTNYNDADVEAESTCKFAEDIGLPYFDTDFSERIFCGSSSDILNRISGLSFVEKFNSELVTNLNSINYAGKNSIISVSGIKKDSGAINIEMFDIRPVQNGIENLLFVGLYRFNESQ